MGGFTFTFETINIKSRKTDGEDPLKEFEEEVIRLARVYPIGESALPLVCVRVSLLVRHAFLCGSLLREIECKPCEQFAVLNYLHAQHCEEQKCPVKLCDGLKNKMIHFEITLSIKMADLLHKYTEMKTFIESQQQVMQQQLTQAVATLARATARSNSSASNILPTTEISAKATSSSENLCAQNSNINPPDTASATTSSVNYKPVSLPSTHTLPHAAQNSSRHRYKSSSSRPNIPTYTPNTLIPFTNIVIPPPPPDSPPPPPEPVKSISPSPASHSTPPAFEPVKITPPSPPSYSPHSTPSHAPSSSSCSMRNSPKHPSRLYSRPQTFQAATPRLRASYSTQPSARFPSHQTTRIVPPEVPSCSSQSLPQKTTIPLSPTSVMPESNIPSSEPTGQNYFSNLLPLSTPLPDYSYLLTQPLFPPCNLKYSSSESESDAEESSFSEDHPCPSGVTPTRELKTQPRTDHCVNSVPQVSQPDLLLKSSDNVDLHPFDSSSSAHRPFSLFSRTPSPIPQAASASHSRSLSPTRSCFKSASSCSQPFTNSSSLSEHPDSLLSQESNFFAPAFASLLPYTLLSSAERAAAMAHKSSQSNRIETGLLSDGIDVLTNDSNEDGISEERLINHERKSTVNGLAYNEDEEEVRNAENYIQGDDEADEESDGDESDADDTNAAEEDDDDHDDDDDDDDGDDDDDDDDEEYAEVDIIQLVKAWAESAIRDRQLQRKNQSP